MKKSSNVAQIKDVIKEEGTALYISDVIGALGLDHFKLRLLLCFMTPIKLIVKVSNIYLHLDNFVADRHFYVNLFMLLFCKSKDEKLSVELGQNLN